jgi:hypothetical protein
MTIWYNTLATLVLEPITSYNASVVKIYNTANGIVHFENKIFSSTLKNAVAY